MCIDFFELIKFLVRIQIYVNLQYINGSFISHYLCVYFTLLLLLSLYLHKNGNTFKWKYPYNRNTGKMIMSSWYLTLFAVEMDGNRMHKSLCKFLYGMLECR